MSENEILEQTKDAYLCLIHPTRRENDYRQKISPLLMLAPSVSDALVAMMISGASWRERLIGLCMAMAKRPETFIEAILQSLRDPRGIAIVPACAVLGVLARQGIFTMPPRFSEMFDRASFDGEVGWAADKAMHIAGLRVENASGRGPNYGQNFDDHVEVYSWIYTSCQS